MRSAILFTRSFVLLSSICLIFGSCSKVMVNGLPPESIALTHNHLMPIDLVSKDWKGIVWDAYNKNWSNPATYNDGQRIAQAGIKWARIWITADQPDSINDAIVSRCSSNGIRIVACYNKVNPYKDLGDTVQQAEQVASLKAFATRYKRWVLYYEIGNEPNLLSYWNSAPGAWNGAVYPSEVGRGSADPNSIYNAGVRRYVKWLHLAHDAIKSVNPGATVILGGISSYIMSDFMNRFLIEKGYLYCDEIASHPYDSKGPDAVVGQLNAFKTKIALWPAPYNLTPVWITEIGFQDTSQALKAANLTGMMKGLIQNLPYARPIFWYILHDNGFALIDQKVTGTTVNTTFYQAYYAYAAMNKSWSFYKSGGN